ncbi:unnamed protein product, partial [Vitis vinifera]|uniref:Uncharacterized protein n=1 Tax=Vitis vinifera TaxID=29760 RepID=D7U8Y9_VITVI
MIYYKKWDGKLLLRLRKSLGNVADCGCRMIFVMYWKKIREPKKLKAYSSTCLV